ncbi:P4HA [Acanthosepion pharaonis]|uniref:P4HA n=1 Tax=Acanthosepion pharaonis TaxID=158019 RepID=A0A812BKZ4_ACAPH|nr:P4HA [Sepia pharaonis]
MLTFCNRLSKSSILASNFRCSSKSLASGSGSFVCTAKTGAVHPEVSFFSRTSRQWNSFPLICFPDNYNLQKFKCNVNRHLLLTSSFPFIFYTFFNHHIPFLFSYFLSLSLYNLLRTSDTPDLLGKEYDEWNWHFCSVFIFEEFLSDNECDNLRRVHDMHVHLMTKEDPILCFDSVKTLQLHLKSAGKDYIEVSPLDFTTDTKCVNQTFSSLLKKWLKANWSYSTAFYPGENYFSKMYEQRVKQAMGLHPENGGKFQIISYPKGIGYKKHTDCIENSSDKRDRMATVIVYLDTVEKGGETRFPELGISVRPRKGRALVWNNMDRDGNCDSMSAHVANSVSNGKKYILQRWYYYQSFYSLGKRPPPTEKPKKRLVSQARVSCDEYTHGSCRWDDEWNHDHLIQYHENKFIKI